MKKLKDTNGKDLRTASLVVTGVGLALSFLGSFIEKQQTENTLKELVDSAVDAKLKSQET